MNKEGMLFQQDRATCHTARKQCKYCISNFLGRFGHTIVCLDRAIYLLYNFLFFFFSFLEVGILRE